MSLEEVKLNLKNLYDKVNNEMKEMQYDTKISDIDDLYTQCVTQLDDEYEKYKKSKPPYDILTSLKNKQLEKEYNRIFTNFEKQTSHINKSKQTLIEAEFNEIKRQEHLKQLENKAEQDFINLNGAIAMLDRNDTQLVNAIMTASY